MRGITDGARSPGCYFLYSLIHHGSSVLCRLGLSPGVSPDFWTCSGVGRGHVCYGWFLETVWGREQVWCPVWHHWGSPHVWWAGMESDPFLVALYTCHTMRRSSAWFVWQWIERLMWHHGYDGHLVTSYSKVTPYNAIATLYDVSIWWQAAELEGRMCRFNLLMRVTTLKSWEYTANIRSLDHVSLSSWLGHIFYTLTRILRTAGA